MSNHSYLIDHNFFEFPHQTHFQLWISTSKLIKIVICYVVHFPRGKRSPIFWAKKKSRPRNWGSAPDRGRISLDAVLCFMRIWEDESYIYIYIYLSIYIYLFIYWYSYRHIDNTHTQICLHISKYIYTYIYTHNKVYVYLYIHMCVYVYIYVCYIYILLLGKS